MTEQRICDWDCKPLECDGQCVPNEAEGEFRTLLETLAVPGECILRKSATWAPANDTDGMGPPEMILHIYKTRKSHAVAPNGHTCPFLTVEEWGRIADWAEAFMKTKAA